VLKQMDW